MLMQEELAFVKAIGSFEFSQVFLRELRKAMAASRKKKALAATKLTLRAFGTRASPRSRW